MCRKNIKISPKKYKCGKKFGKNCSQIFEKNYGIDDFRIILLAYVKKTSYRFAFLGFPRNKDGSFESTYFCNFAQGLYEKVKLVLIENEKKDPSFSCENLNGYIFGIVSRFLREVGKVDQDIDQITVNDEIIRELKIMLNKPSLDIEELLPLGRRSLSTQAKLVLEDIKQIPGYANVWFRVRGNKGNRKLFMFVPEEDKLRKIENVIREREFGGRKDAPSYDEFFDSSKKDPRLSENTIECDTTTFLYDNGERLIPLEERLENFFKILNTLERCVYKYRIKLSYPLKEVTEKCWGKPVAITNVNRVINEIITKMKEQF